ncbi:peptidase family M1-domain-containing protein [Lentinula aff. lateritia]|uniref:Peptidase family M1-domain-containing protein n=1 Tax=Lentinula aff. lateritia TaxID=2804960 RepID=A0ACC1TZ31_9AGAR|nr:peptidase family M1-domain-containing protein [Lentinula aff. lateritia]
MNYRLPTDVSPTHYDLTLLTDLTLHKFRGTVEVDLKVVTDTSKIVLNVAELHLSDASVTVVGEEEAFVPVSQSIDSIDQRATFIYPCTFTAGSSLKLFVAFEGKLNESLIGYYEGTWEDGGQKKIYTVTQFEPTAARRAFPCWDEPSCKATFEMSMISASDTVNLFNTPVISEEQYEDADDVHGLLRQASIGDWKITRFERSPLMSTYLVAFANGQFEYLKSSFKTKYTLGVTAKVLPVYEQVFDIEYPLPKLDTLVIEDMDAYAMENWGLITGRASHYLLDPNASNIQQKQAIVNIQFHEVAHMWFGNITTMEWWTYLYLNEGVVFPEWNLDAAFIVLHINDAMLLDNKLSSHAVEVDCPDANKINQIFDALSYSKAASVLRMLANHVGVDAFLKGVSVYLKANLYGNSVTHDLWKGIEEATGFDPSNFMDAYISKPGFPVIEVTESEGIIHIVQARFLQKGTIDDTNTIWNIPLNLLTVDSNGKSSINKVVLKEQSSSYAVNTEQLFKLNAGTFGYYRVMYTPERFRRIAIEAAKETSVLNTGDRLGLVQDAFALAGAQLMNLSDALELLTIFKDVRDYYLWSSISTALSNLINIWWEHAEVIDLLNELRRFLFKPIVSEIRYTYFADEDPDTSLLRTCAVINASQAKDEEVVNELRQRFKQYQATRDNSLIPEELQGPIYTSAVEFGGEEEYLAIKRIVDDPKTPTEKLAAIGAMCSVADHRLITSTIHYMTTEARDQDVPHFVLELMKNPKIKREFVAHFKENYNVLYEKFKDGFSISGLVQRVFSPLTSKKDWEDTKAFFEDGRDTSRYALTVPQVLVSIQENMAYIEVGRVS